MEKFFNGILLIGSDCFIKQTKEALTLIWETEEAWYNFVRGNIGVIQEGEQSGMHVYSKPPRFEVGKPTWSSTITWYSSAIVHDAYHSLLYQQKKIHYGRDAERKCMEVQMQYLKACDAPANEYEHVKRIYDTDYDYYSSEKRDW